jgi:hypothetical protein
MIEILTIGSDQGTVSIEFYPEGEDSDIRHILRLNPISTQGLIDALTLHMELAKKQLEEQAGGTND